MASYKALPYHLARLIEVLFCIETTKANTGEPKDLSQHVFSRAAQINSEGIGVAEPHANTNTSLSSDDKGMVNKVQY